MRRFLALAGALTALAAFFVLTAGTAGADEGDDLKSTPRSLKIEQFASPSGAFDFRDMVLGTNITECPQAGMNTEPNPEELDRREVDAAEKKSDRGDETRANTEYSCFPQNETSLDTNPLHRKNIVAGANDYRLGWASSGFYASRDGGEHWYDGWIPFPSLPSGDNLDGGGDPAVVFDRAGVVYYADINFNRTDDTNGVWVSRSTNGGFTWSRPCVVLTDTAPCGGPGDPRQPGDGTVTFTPENIMTPPAPDFSVTFNDKEYIAAGPRPEGVAPTCYTPATRAPRPCRPRPRSGLIGSTSPGRGSRTRSGRRSSSRTPRSSRATPTTWAGRGRRRQVINGSAPFCTGSFAGGTACDDNQFSVPTVSPKTGHVYVAFENFDTVDENQWLVVRSTDGGATWSAPSFVTTAYDVNLRLKADCVARGASRVHLTNSCFRIPYTGAIVADKRGGAFADDLYLVMEDNRNGTRDSTNTDVFFFKSTDGGSSWIGPTRVNDDASASPANRDCGRNPAGPELLQPACPAGVNTGNDQFWPWIDVNEQGHMSIVMKDRRLDVDSIASEWPTSRARPGNYLVWTWGANCRITSSNNTSCVASAAGLIPQPAGPVNPAATDIPPGAGPTYTGPWRNYGVSSVPSNYDYSFRAGIFAGDYESVALDEQPRVHADDGCTKRPLVRRSGWRCDRSVAARPQPGVRAVGRVLRLVAVEQPRCAEGTEQSEGQRLALPRYSVPGGRRRLRADRARRGASRPPFSPESPDESRARAVGGELYTVRRDERRPASSRTDRERGEALATGDQRRRATRRRPGRLAARSAALVIRVLDATISCTRSRGAKLVPRIVSGARRIEREPGLRGRGRRAAAGGRRRPGARRRRGRRRAGRERGAQSERHRPPASPARRKSARRRSTNRWLLGERGAASVRSGACRGLAGARRPTSRSVRNT